MIGRLALAAVVLAAAGWFIALRPQALGGPAAYILVAGQSMEPTIHPGSLVILFRRPQYAIGDVVAYRVPPGDPGAGLRIIHRIVGGSASAGFVMRGDNTPSSDLWRPKPEAILGSAQVVIPGAMPVLLFARSPIVAASVAAGLAAYFALGFWAEDRRRPKSPRPPPGWRAYTRRKTLVRARAAFFPPVGWIAPAMVLTAVAAMGARSAPTALAALAAPAALTLRRSGSQPATTWMTPSALVAADPAHPPIIDHEVPGWPSSVLRDPAHSLPPVPHRCTSGCICSALESAYG
jgi:signal peptidase I